MGLKELFFLTSLSLDATIPEKPAITDPTDLILLAEENGIPASAVVSPKIPLQNCATDLTEYPNVRLLWPYKGPVVNSNETAVFVGETNLETGDVLNGGHVLDFETVKAASARNVAVVLAVDTSGSMGDNVELTNQIINKVKKHYNDALVKIYNISYDTNVINPHEKRHAHHRQYYMGLSYNNEENHLGALTESLDVLQHAVRGSTKHVILLTDEGDKRGTEQERAQIIKNAKKQGVQVHLIYDKGETPASNVAPNSIYGYGYSLRPARSQNTEDFSSLIKLAKSTGGGARHLSKGQVPNIFQTKFVKEEYTSINFLPERPYEPGLRKFVVPNGGGAVCEVDITSEAISLAIDKGSLPEPTVIETNETQATNYLSRLRAECVAAIMVGMAGLAFFATATSFLKNSKEE